MGIVGLAGILSIAGLGAGAVPAEDVRDAGQLHAARAAVLHPGRRTDLRRWHFETPGRVRRRRSVGHWRGGLGHASVVSSMVFAGVSGSSVADTSAIGSILVPAMKSQRLQARLRCRAGRLRRHHRRHHPAEHDDDRLRLDGQRLDRRAVSGRHHPGVLIGIGLMIVIRFYARAARVPGVARRRAAASSCARCLQRRRRTSGRRCWRRCSSSAAFSPACSRRPKPASSRASTASSSASSSTAP